MISDERSHTDIFSKIYRQKIWGNGVNRPLSGCGSKINYNQKYINFLVDFLKENKIIGVLDIGCGDWTFSKTIKYQNMIDDKENYHLKIYLGLDCVPSVIENNLNEYGSNKIQFRCLDCRDKNIIENLDETNHYDLVILKDILQHWSNSEIIEFLNRVIKCKFKYVLIINGKNIKEGEVRDINNKYSYANLRGDLYPLSLFQPKILFNYQYKQVCLIEL